MPTKRAPQPKTPRYRAERRSKIHIVLYGAKDHPWRVIGPKETILCQSALQARRISRALNQQSSGRKGK